MSTPIDDRSVESTADPADPVTPIRRRPRWLPAALAGAAVAAAVTGVLAVSAVTDSKPASPPVAAPAKTQVAMKLPDGASMASCMVFDVKVLAAVPVAFGGTVSDVTDSSVVIDVDRWYRGGSADQVVLSIPSQQTSAALDGVDFVRGQRYLVSATDGTVNGCGLSGPATADLEAAFQEAFPS